MPGAQNLVGRLMRPDSAASRMLLALLRSLGNELGSSGSAGLSPALGDSVLSHVGVSERYLRAVLAANGETFSSYVRRHRLQRCALLLKDPPPATPRSPKSPSNQASATPPTSARPSKPTTASRRGTID